MTFASLTLQIRTHENSKDLNIIILFCKRTLLIYAINIDVNVSLKKEIDVNVSLLKIHLYFFVFNDFEFILYHSIILNECRLFLSQN